VCSLFDGYYTTVILETGDLEHDVNNLDHTEYIQRYRFTKALNTYKGIVLLKH